MKTAFRIMLLAACLVSAPAFAAKILPEDYAMRVPAASTIGTDIRITLIDSRARAVADAREKAAGLAVAFGGGLGPVYSINSLNSRQSDGYGITTLDRIEVTGSRIDSGRYLQPMIDFTERVSAVFEITERVSAVFEITH